MYPNANIWLTGHSLGGGLSSLIGATFGVPVVAFESPAERLASQRLHLPRPVSICPFTTKYIQLIFPSLRWITLFMYTTPLTYVLYLRKMEDFTHSLLSPYLWVRALE